MFQIVNKLRKSDTIRAMYNIHCIYAHNIRLIAPHERIVNNYNLLLNIIVFFSTVF